MSSSSRPLWLSATISILSYALYPIIFVLTAVWNIVVFLSTPFTYIGRILANISLVPWRIFAHFEALWYFLGSAIILGLLLGLLLHYSLRAFVVVFRLDRKPPAKPPAPKGHDAVSYRKAREAKKKKHLEEQRSLATQARLIASQPLIQEVVREARKTPLSTAPATPLSPLSPNIAGPSRPGLLQETILEHSDEDDDDSVF